jgi:hypothetical protein
MTTMLRVPRSRGALSGSLLLLLGLWGALVPLVGPYFHFAFTPDKAWTLTSGRVWLQIVPGCAVILGGLIALASANRAFAALGAWLAALGGGWFTVGVPLSGLWASHGHTLLGPAVGGTTRRVAEQVSLLYGLGVVVVFLAALALGRLAVVGVKDALLAEQETRVEENPVPEPEAEAARTGSRPGLPLRRRAAKAERVPPTPPEQTAPRTVGPSDVKVAGTPAPGEPPTGGRPGANA